MPDRVIRESLLDSERWLDLPSDTHRLAFVGLILQVDDFGNFEGGPRRIFRLLQQFTQVKGEPDAIKIMSDLHDADMARPYQHEGKDFWHLPRFQNKRTYWSRKCPPSPWCDANAKLGAFRNQELAKKSDADLKQNCDNPASSLTDGVGVGVGVGVGKTLSLALAGFDAFWIAYPRKKAKGAAEKAWKKLKPSEQLAAEIIDAVSRAKTSRDWTKDGGQFIPYPATYLTKKMWFDETEERVRILV